MTKPLKCRLFLDSYETRIALYESIHNLPQILQLMQTNDNLCLINAKTVFDVNHLLCAINKSIGYKMIDKLITKQVNKEILFSLSLSKNITDSLNTFGVKPSDHTLPIIAISVDQINDTLNTYFFDQIDGKALPIESLKCLRDDSLIDRIYKLKDTSSESEKWDLIVSRLATKDII
ncbi:unnamed protein product [Medioppia subpectinata]|uniref:EKC/KEOPS complex subunit CGI121 n=1 Tax=Medioppia subpectinata TaxID=1979941 RepID=A0A7R9KCJ8_9ACAR|nr:unnamed protein product [Medioppia subpectinata]CAG2100987.1 unnamed protein product [Medioppia subpectinata]